MGEDERIDGLVDLFFEVGTLRKVQRMHQQEFLTSDPSDNIASHSFRVALIGLFLARQEDVDAEQVMAMCLLHDIPETRSGDQNWIHQHYVEVDEDGIRDDQLEQLPGADNLRELCDDYDERSTPAARIAKDADVLEQILLLKEHAHAGNEEAERWLSDISHYREILSSETALRLADAIRERRPSRWITAIHEVYEE